MPVQSGSDWANNSAEILEQSQAWLLLAGHTHSAGTWHCQGRNEVVDLSLDSDFRVAI